MKDGYLVIDIGTGTTRVAIVSDNAEIAAINKADTVCFAEDGIAGSSCFDANAWKDTIFGLIKRTVKQAVEYRVVAATCCSLREGIVAIDGCGRSLKGYMNSDRRGLPFIDELNWNLIWDKAGLYISPIYSAVKLFGERRLNPEIIEKTAYISSISDWLGFLFTGKLVWERAQAMHSALYDPIRAEWSDELCRHFSVKEGMMPPIMSAGEILGQFSQSACAELELNEIPYYIVGTADTQAALACVSAEEDEIVVVSGTTSPTVRILSEYEKHPKTWTSPSGWSDKYMLEVNTFSSGINLQRIKNNLLPQYSYAELNEEARRMGLPKDNLPRVYAVFSSGSHIDEPSYVGGLVMPNPIPIDIRPGEFFHAMTLNTAMSICKCIEKQRSIRPLKYDYIIGCGNGFMSETIAQAVADITGLRLAMYKNWNEATIYGMWTICQRGMGRKTPERIIDKEYRPDCSEKLKKYYEQWQDCRTKINSIEV